MHGLNSTPSAPKLSICITTFNRAGFIGATIDSILPQLTEDCELVILDGASTDHTQQVVSDHARQCERLRYLRQENNQGFDRDCDHMVQRARGEYCWLMTDDDLFKPNAVAVVLEALRRDWSLIIVNTEVQNFNMSKVVQPRCLDMESDRVYRAEQWEQVVADVGGMLTYVGGFIVQRAIWVNRDNSRYYGSSFVHVGAMFQAPLPGDTLVVAEPLVSYRMGNVHSWSGRWFELFVCTWPSLVWSLPLSDAAKRKVCPAERWRDVQQLLQFRGQGCYSLAEYRRLIHPKLNSVQEMLVPALIALLPGVIVNQLLVLYYSLTNGKDRGMLLQFMKESRFYFRNWQVLGTAERV